MPLGEQKVTALHSSLDTCARKVQIGERPASIMQTPVLHNSASKNYICLTKRCVGEGGEGKRRLVMEEGKEASESKIPHRYKSSCFCEAYSFAYSLGKHEEKEYFCKQKQYPGGGGVFC